MDRDVDFKDVVSRGAVLALLLCASACYPAPAADRKPAAPLRAVAPSGAVILPLEFRWEGAGADTVVRVHVSDEAERPLQEIEARGDRVAAPASLERLLTPGTTYLWRVARVDDNGEESDASELTRFTIAPR